jgi:nitroreductase
MSSARQAAITPALEGCDSGRQSQYTVDRVITSRVSCRAFSNRAVPRATIEDILDVARFAPCGANTQPWRVYVVAGTVKEEISRRLLNAHEQSREQHSSEYQYYACPLPEPYLSRRNEYGRIFYGALGIQQSDTEGRLRQTSRNYSFFGASVGLIFTIDRRLQVGSWLDLGMFIQNIMIAAVARGLDSCPQETFSKYHVLLRELLAIAPEEVVVCGMSIGFADETHARERVTMPKAPIDEFARFVGFGEVVEVDQYRLNMEEKNDGTS